MLDIDSIDISAFTETERYEIARIQFATNEFATLRNLSVRLDLDYWKLRKKARSGQWMVERMKNIGEIRREAIESAKTAIASIAVSQIVDSLKQLHKVRMSALELLHIQIEEGKKAKPEPVLFEDTLRYEGYERQPGPDGKIELRPWTRTVRRGLPRPDAKVILDLVMDGMHKLARMAGLSEDAESKDSDSNRFLLE